MSAEKLRWICTVPLGTTIAALGLLGNMLSIYVWHRLVKGKCRGNPSTGIYLIVLGKKIYILGTAVSFYEEETTKRTLLIRDQPFLIPGNRTD